MKNYKMICSNNKVLKWHFLISPYANALNMDQSSKIN